MTEGKQNHIQEDTTASWRHVDYRLAITAAPCQQLRRIVTNHAHINY